MKRERSSQDLPSLLSAMDRKRVGSREQGPGPDEQLQSQRLSRAIARQLKSGQHLVSHMGKLFSLFFRFFLFSFFFSLPFVFLTSHLL